MAMNSSQKMLRRNQERCWEVKLLTSKLIASKNTENTCANDLQDYLLPKVIKEMSRKDGTKFKYVKFDTGNITK